MTNKGVGQYDLEYAQCECFWGLQPGKFVTLLIDKLEKGPILDLGAGEGKNAIALAQEGFFVTAVECSTYAINNFKQRLRSLDHNIMSRIEIIQTDVRFFESNERFQAVIAYGLLHCLTSKPDIYRVVDFMKKSTLPGGYNVLVSLTNSLSLSEVHNYLTPTLLPADNFREMYRYWQIEKFEDTILTEVHPTSKTKHKHGICRILARRPEKCVKSRI